MTNEKDTQRAEEQARAQLDGIVQMVKRLEHLDDCDDWEGCDLTDEQILDGLGYSHEKGKEATDEERESYHDRDATLEAMQEDPLSVQVRSGWASSPAEFEAEEFEILLCTGGPACRIIGDLGRYNQPDRARLQYQDWGTPWTEYLDMTSEERDALLTYCQQFYFGE